MVIRKQINPKPRRYACVGRGTVSALGWLVKQRRQAINEGGVMAKVNIDGVAYDTDTMSQASRQQLDMLVMTEQKIR